MSWWGTTTPAPREMNGMWWPYFALLIFALCMQIMTSTALLFWGCASVRRRCCKRRVSPVTAHVAVIVPCYLPNEEGIIRGTLEHILNKLRHVESLDVHLVYNTPHDMQIEAELKAMAKAPQPAGRRLLVERCMHSKSKAENLNSIIPRLGAKYTVIYDADHHPDPDSLALAIEHLDETGVDCVQGSTYIRAGSCLLRTLIHAEFFMTYFVILPMIQGVAGTGLFGGANGIWLTSSLQKQEFDTQRLTEDIDFFVRASLNHGMKFTFLPEVRSGELAPASVRDLWKQRLRWSMGWDEVTVKNLRAFFTCPLSARRRLGLIYMFVMRWPNQFATFLIISINIRNSLVRLSGTHDTPTMPDEIRYVQMVSGVLFLSMLVFTFCQVLMHEPYPRLLLGMLAYFTLSPLYGLYTSVLLLVSLTNVLRGATGKWVVTKRASSANDASSLPPLSAEELGGAKEPSTFSRVALAVLSLGFVALGCFCGGVLGARLYQHTVEHPLWGWVPFGIGETQEEVVDPQSVFFGALAGGLVCLALLLLVRWFSSCCSRRGQLSPSPHSLHSPLLQTQKVASELPHDSLQGA